MDDTQQAESLFDQVLLIGEVARAFNSYACPYLFGETVNFYESLAASDEEYYFEGDEDKEDVVAPIDVHPTMYRISETFRRERGYFDLPSLEDNQEFFDGSSEPNIKRQMFADALVNLYWASEVVGLMMSGENDVGISPDDFDRLRHLFFIEFAQKIGEQSWRDGNSSAGKSIDDMCDTLKDIRKKEVVGQMKFWKNKMPKREQDICRVDPLTQTILERSEKSARRFAIVFEPRG